MRSHSHSWNLIVRIATNGTPSVAIPHPNGGLDANGEVSPRKAAHWARCRLRPSACSRWISGHLADGATRDSEVEAEGLIGAAGADSTRCGDADVGRRLRHGPRTRRGGPVPPPPR